MDSSWWHIDTFSLKQSPEGMLQVFQHPLKKFLVQPLETLPSLA